VDLGPLLAPRSIAVIGATDRRDSYAGNVLRNLERAGYPGEVWGVNPKRSEVLGRPCVASVEELPKPVDALVVAIPAAAVAGAVRAGAARGCGGAIVLSAGFAEVESGRGYQAELREIARAHGLPVCGPNGNGIVAVAERAAMWGDGLARLEPGPVAMVTQSGNVGVNALGSRRGIRWHTVVSTGNQAVCDASSWLAALSGRDGVRAVALFLESDDDGAKLAEALALCAERKIGVAVLKVGSSEAGARAASAHTGALAGDQRVFRALVEEAGGAWAEDIHDLLELAKALAEPRARPNGSGGLAVLTCSGGDSGVAGDQAASLGVELPELSAATSRRLAELLPEAATIANPLDYTAMIWGETDLLHRIVEVVGDDEAIDQLLLC
jgi:acyl-CoA synthetase (NDP forming)